MNAKQEIYDVLNKVLPDEISVLRTNQVEEIIGCVLADQSASELYFSSDAPGHLTVLEIVNTVAQVAGVICAAFQLRRANRSLTRSEILERLSRIDLTTEQRDDIAAALIEP